MVQSNSEHINTPATSTLSPGSILPEFGRTQYSYIYDENKWMIVVGYFVLLERLF